MTLPTILTWTQLSSAILLMISILLQQRGGGLSSGIVGGSGMEFRTKRGMEKGLFTAAIVLTVVFIVASVARLVVS